MSTSILLSHPRGVNSSPFHESLVARWHKAVTRHPGGPVLQVSVPTLTENHGAFLTRQWVSEIRPRLEDGDDVLVSELDFIPNPDLTLRLQAIAERFIFSQYVTRVYQPGDSVLLKPGKLVRHEEKFPGPTDDAKDAITVPLVGPWFMFLPHGRWARDLPDYWLDAAGPFNDAANYALAHLRGAGVKTPVTVMRGSDLWPLAWGVEYDGLGAHLFFHRHLEAPGDEVVCWPECSPGLTGEDVRRSYFKALKALPE